MHSSVESFLSGRRSQLLAAIAVLLVASVATADEKAPAAAQPADAASMKPYEVTLPGTKISFEMMPIPGGTFRMGSPESEADRGEDEGPVHEVTIAPFWMGKCEVTWDEYELFMFALDVHRREVTGRAASDLEKAAETVTRPTKPYTDMTFGMGKEGFPAICMTQLAAKKYCEWLSAITGQYYRLPTEAEWEYACRAGTNTAYSFGDDPAQLDDYAWYYDNSDEAYHKVGEKKANPWGLHDMHGNVAEWCLDQYAPDTYAKPAAQIGLNPYNLPVKLDPRSVRGGSWDDDPEKLRSAARVASTNDWKKQDPQIPQSIWYHTDALFLGFRVVRPLAEPTAEDRARFGADQSQQ